MKDEDLLHCPLLRGLDAMHRAELIGLLNDSKLRSALEKCVAENIKAGDGEEPVTCSQETEPRNFDQDVHNWNPQKLIFSRSPKE